jgi:carbon storage regulator
MLVFTRSKKQQIIINDSIVVTVVDIRGEKIRLGIEAPREIAVHRREIHDSIREEKVVEGTATSREEPAS